MKALSCYSVQRLLSKIFIAFLFSAILTSAATHSLTVISYRDADGFYYSLDDRTPKGWHFDLLKDAPDGTLIQSFDTPNDAIGITIPDLDDASEYFLSASDSSGWIFIGAFFPGPGGGGAANFEKPIYLDHEDTVEVSFAPPAYSAEYRTATYRDWADAKDQKDKRKAIKCKANNVDFKVNVRFPLIEGTGEAPSILKLKFSLPVDSIHISLDKNKQNIITCWGAAIINFTKPITWTIDFHDCGPFNPGTLIQLDCHGLTGKIPKVHYEWYRQQLDQLILVTKGDLPGKPSPLSPNDSLKNVYLRFPMPNLHNVGEDIYGGVMQTPVNITVATSPLPIGAHTVYLPKYKDVLKSLVKEEKNGFDLYHTAPPHCLNKFDKNHKEILTKQKGLPPDKHNNRLFAEQLTLKLNVAASDSGIFPSGLGDLIYDNSGLKSPAPPFPKGPFDGMTVRQIIDSVDKYLGCNGVVAGTDDSTEFLKVDSLINAAFAGPIDTFRWSCGKVICTGVRKLGDVHYLHANPSAVPMVFASPIHSPMNLEPEKYTLYQNYPNPFNPVTVISYSLSAPSLVTLKIFNTLGQEVAELIHNELMDEGEQEVEFDASALSSGVYYYKIVVKDAQGKSVLYSKENKMVLVK